MPRLFTLDVLITRSKQRADLENSTHISSDEWQSLVSEQYGELWGIVAESGGRYFETSTTLTSTGAAYLSEPAAILSYVGLNYLPTGASGERWPLQEIMAQEVPAYSGQSGTWARYYALIDDRINLYPTPPTGQSYELLYVPQATDLSAPTPTSTQVDVVTPDGEAFVIWGTAVKALAKSESDVRLAMAEREAARTRLEQWATIRSLHQPKRRIVDPFGYDLPIDAADWRWRR